MECKYVHEFPFTQFAPRINRYIMECKYIMYKKEDIHTVAELIDTLWNVNEVRRQEGK